MKVEVVCQGCGTINRNEVPIPSKSDGLELCCVNCGVTVITFFSDDSLMGKYIENLWKDIDKKKSKVVKP